MRLEKLDVEHQHEPLQHVLLALYRRGRREVEDEGGKVGATRYVSLRTDGNYSPRKVFAAWGTTADAQITSNTPRAGNPVDSVTALEYNCTC
jgi:hypothetical protein